MAYEFNGTNQFLSGTSAPVTATPLTIACWFYVNTASGSALGGIENSSSQIQLFNIGADAGGQVRLNVFESISTNGTAVTTATYTANAWNHCCGVFTSSTSRTIFLNGGNQVTNTTSVTPSGINGYKIATRLFDGSNSAFFNGRIAEFGIWDAALTADEVVSLSKGFTCDKVRPQNLQFYAPLCRDLIDLKGRAITNNNTATVAAHPRVYA